MPETDITILTRPIDPGLYRRGRGFAVLDMVFLPIEPAPSAPLSLPQPAPIGYTSFAITDVELTPLMDLAIANMSTSTPIEYLASAPYGIALGAPLSLTQSLPMAYTSFMITDVETAPFLDSAVVNTATTTAASYGTTIQG